MIEQLNYLPLADADRDLMTYRASVRGSLTVGPRISVYISPFVNRRDARLRVDSSGIDRDATTAGVLGGVAFDLTGRLEGNLGLGVFHPSPTMPGCEHSPASPRAAASSGIRACARW